MVKVPNNFKNDKPNYHSGFYPLSIAIMHNWRKDDCARALLEEGDADPNLQDQNERGWTPLHHAVYWAQENVVLLLLKHGANTQLHDNDNKKPIEVCRQYSYASDKKALELFASNIEALELFASDIQEYNTQREAVENQIKAYEAKQAAASSVQQLDSASADKDPVGEIQNAASQLAQRLNTAPNKEEQVQAINAFYDKYTSILEGITNSSIIKAINAFITATLVTALATTVGFGVGFALGWWTGPGAFFTGLAAGAYAETIVTAVGVATGVAAGGIKAYGLFKTSKEQSNENLDNVATPPDGATILT